MGARAVRPSLSVVIPARNAAATLGQQLRALARQVGAEEFEVLVVDDASTDATPDIVRDLAEHDGRFRLLQTDSNGTGASRARNHGTAAARSPLVAYCDADDIVAPGWVASLTAGLADADLVGGVLEDEVLNPPDCRMWRSSGRMSALPRTLGFLPYAVSANCAVHKRWWDELGGWDESLRNGEDVDFSWRVQLAGGRLAFAPDAVVHYRHRCTVLAACRQAMDYALGEVELFTRYEHLGARARPLSLVATRYVYLVTRLPYLLATHRRRGLWLVVASGLWGRLRGSARRRVVCL